MARRRPTPRARADIGRSLFTLLFSFAMALFFGRWALALLGPGPIVVAAFVLGYVATYIVTWRMSAGLFRRR